MSLSVIANRKKLVPQAIRDPTFLLLERTPALDSYKESKEHRLQQVDTNCHHQWSTKQHMGIFFKYFVEEQAIKEKSDE